MPACYTEGPGFKPLLGSPIIFKIDFHQHKLSSLFIARNIRQEGALCSVFCADASKRPWTSLNYYGMCQTPSLITLSLRLPLAAGHISWLSLRSIALSQYNTTNGSSHISTFRPTLRLLKQSMVYSCITECKWLKSSAVCRKQFLAHVCQVLLLL